MSEVKMEDLVSLCKRRGFIFQGSEVYGGLAGTWDYGPLGVALKRNVMQLWWKTFVEDRDDMYGVDAAILMNQKVWQASGHTETFTDPLVECSNCHGRFRADHLIKDYEMERDSFGDVEQRIEEYGRDYEKIKREDPKLFTELLEREQGPDPVSDIEEEEVVARIKCPACDKRGTLGAPKQFNMMFRTFVGPNQGEEVSIGKPLADNKKGVDLEGRKAVTFDPNSVSYLRPETAQGIFTNFKNVVDSFYPDLPFGIAQQGKAFRNEISPRDFVFRSREFEQMEVEYFVHPDKWEQAFEQWVKDINAFLTEGLGIPADKIHELEVPAEERAHYSKRTIDFEFDYPHKRDELLGLAYRTDYDLSNIQKASGRNMEYTIKGTDERFIPHVIEPSFGVERAIMAVLLSAYREDEVNGEKRVFLQLPAHLAPVKVAVSPLLKNKPELVEKAQEVYKMLKKEFGNVMYDDNGNIGKRYRRQDEIGTPYCVTIDFDTLQNNTVTIRNRDTTEQERIKIDVLTTELS